MATAAQAIPATNAIGVRDLAAKRGTRDTHRPSLGEAVATTSDSAAASANDSATDRALVERAQGGDPRAFDQLVVRYQHRIATVIGQYLRDPSEIEDVAQDAFLKAYRALDRFRGDSSFYTWLYRIAVNTAKNHLDALSRRVTSHGVEPDEAERYDDGALLRHGDSPERELRRGEVQRTLERTLADLPNHLRDAVMLREMRGLSYEAIARLMDCPIGTVRSRIARGRGLIDNAVGPLLESASAGEHIAARS